ncbi:MAG: hypothetical protein E4G94_02860 [ANME-2 cluster archaeon]|nr:MAG: hypothetical protein E4G94_02860 [ANME-2 cluster archaeon]
MVKQSHINLEKDGLDKFISPFEGEILTTLWNEGNLTSADIQKSLEKRDPTMHIATVSGLLRLRRTLIQCGIHDLPVVGKSSHFIIFDIILS